MSRHQRRVIKLVSALMIVGTAAGANASGSYAESDTQSEKNIGSVEITIPLPTFQHEDFYLKPHKTPADDHEFPSDNRMPRTVQILRARNLLAAGHYEEAIADYREDFKEFIGERTPGPETASRYTRLAELYIKNKRYRDALDSSEKALIASKDQSAALFVKAQAEAGLGNLDNARADAKAAVDDYFGKAEIVLRDRVLEWLKTLPSS